MDRYLRLICKLDYVCHSFQLINDATHIKRKNSYAITNHKPERVVMEAVVACFTVLPRGRSETRIKHVDAIVMMGIRQDSLPKFVRRNLKFNLLKPTGYVMHQQV
jgi:hypothetical protein